MHLRLSATLAKLVAIAAALAAAPSPGAAGGGAPQALALVSTDGPVALACDRGGCRARLSSFCLERDRDAPEAGRAYELAAGALVLLVEDSAGARRVPLPAGAVFAADRGHRSVTLDLPPETVARWPEATFALEVGPMATLLPAVADDGPDRHDAAQVAAVTGPLRAAGKRTVEGAGAEIAAARFLNRAINDLPAAGGGTGGPGGEDEWERILAGAPAGAGQALAAGTFEACQRSTRQGLFYNIRNCLILRHDRLMDGLNDAYWQAVAGS